MAMDLSDDGASAGPFVVVVVAGCWLLLLLLLLLLDTMMLFWGETLLRTAADRAERSEAET